MKWKQRKVCHECGQEVTNRKIYLIYSAEIKLPIKVCSLCHARYVRRTEKSNGKKKKSRS